MKKFLSMDATELRVGWTSAIKLKRIPPLAATGLCLVIGAAAGSETELGDGREIAFTLRGGTSLIRAHTLNRNTCRHTCANTAPASGYT